MRIVFFGTSRFAQTILDYLLDQGVEVAAVVTRPDKPRGRSSSPAYSPVKEWALSNKLPLYQPNKVSDPLFEELLKKFESDFFIVAAFAEILKENILAIPRLGCLNVHGSILPKYRGAAPVQRAIMAGETESGVTIMKMALEMDAGDILEIRKVEIPPEMTAGELMDQLAEVGKVALFEAMQKLIKNSSTPIRQNSDLASYAKKIKPEDAQIDWRLPAEVVHNRIRGVTPNPGAWCWVEIKGEKKRLLVKKTVLSSGSQALPGEIATGNPLELIISCGQGCLKLLEVQLEGKKSLPVEAFLRGISLDRIRIPVD